MPENLHALQNATMTKNGIAMLEQTAPNMVLNHSVKTAEKVRCDGPTSAPLRRSRKFLLLLNALGYVRSKMISATKKWALQLLIVRNVLLTVRIIAIIGK